MLHIVIPVYSGWDQLEKCLNALEQGTFQDFTVIVVDHSPPDTRVKKPASHRKVIRLRAESSLWWAGATNRGIEYALARQAERIMLLNHDCYVGRETLSTLMEHSKRKKGAIIAPVQKEDSSGRILLIAPEECIWLGFADGRQGPLTIPPDTGGEKLLAASLVRGGRGVVIPGEIFQKLGLLDEDNLPHYYADHDFFVRCQRAAVPLYTALDADVFIDNQQTSLALKPEELTLGEFIRSFASRRSHRNMADLRMFFYKHYPLRSLYLLGFFLSVLRYTAVYAGKRIKKMI